MGNYHKEERIFVLGGWDYLIFSNYNKYLVVIMILSHLCVIIHSNTFKQQVSTEEWALENSQDSTKSEGKYELIDIWYIFAFFYSLSRKCLS